MRDQALVVQRAKIWSEKDRSKLGCLWGWGKGLSFKFTFYGLWRQPWNTHSPQKRNHRGSLDVMNYEGFYIWFYLDCVSKVELVYNYGGPEKSLMCSLDFHSQRKSRVEAVEMPWIFWTYHGISQAPKTWCCSLKCAKEFSSVLWPVMALWKEVAAPGSEDFRYDGRRLVKFR